MILYGAPISPYVRKVLVYAAEKGIALDHHPTSPFAPPPEFLECSPFRKIPAFSDGDFKISDSTAIVTYLEAKFPEPPMIPADPAERARTVWFDEFADTIVVSQAGAVFFNRIVASLIGQTGDLAAADKAEKEGVPPLLDYLECIVPASGFLVGDRLTLADVSVTSPFVNLDFAGVKIDAGKYPKTSSYLNAMRERPSFANLLSAERAMLGIGG